jgi:hypothetical protein
MNAYFRGLLVAAIAAGTAGCSFALRPVVMNATPADWAALNGEWRGEYTMDGHDRRGLITFRLQAEAQQASGDVLMVPDRFALPYAPMRMRDADAREQAKTAAQLLSIRFVSADHGRIHGTMDPYWDPDRSCQAWASFVGSVDGTVIAGRLVSVCEDGVRTLTGRWRVTLRERPGR